MIQSVVSGTLTDTIPALLNQIADRAQISQVERRALYVQGWSEAVEHALEDNLLNEAEEKQLVRLQNTLLLTQEDLERDGSYSRVTKAAVLRDVCNGIVPKRVVVDGGALLFNLQKTEQIVWAFPQSDYLEDKTRREYVGGSHGISIRISRGVYYRVGAFKGRPVERTERRYVDTGMALVTNKHIYFGGSRKSLRVPYSKVISFQPFSDGIGVVRDSANAKLQVFVTGDGWFMYNLVTNLARL
jgi:hypothetical protein